MGELATQVKLLLKAKAIRLPLQFDPGMIKVMKPGDPALQTGNIGAVATALFIPASSMKIHVETVQTVSGAFEELIDSVSQALVSGWSGWAGSVMFTGVVINATVGILPPGGMVGGPQLQPGMMLAQVKPSQKLPQGQRYAQAILTAIGTGLLGWAQAYTHPTLVFPGGAMCVGTMPPSPNAPMPLGTGMSPGEAMLTAPLLKGQMLGMCAGQHADALYDAFAQAFVMLFQRWKMSTLITGIMGAGGAASPLGSPVAGAVGNGGKLAGAPVT